MRSLGTHAFCLEGDRLPVASAESAAGGNVINKQVQLLAEIQAVTFCLYLKSFRSAFLKKTDSLVR